MRGVGSHSKERSGDDSRNDEGGSPFGAGFKGPTFGASGRRHAQGDSIEDSDRDGHRKSVEHSSMEGDGDGLLDTMYGGRGRRPVPGKDFIMDDKDVDPKLLAKYRSKTSGEAGKRANRKGQGTDAELETNMDAASGGMMAMMRPIVPQSDSFCQTEVNFMLMSTML